MEKRVSPGEVSAAIDDMRDRGDERVEQVAETVTVGAAAILEEVAESTAADAVVLGDECEEEIPFAEMWIRRTPDGVVVRVCGHVPEHLTIISS